MLEHWSMFLTDSKIKKLCNKGVENYPLALEYVPESYKTQEMCDKSVDTYPSTIKICS